MVQDSSHNEAPHRATQDVSGHVDRLTPRHAKAVALLHRDCIPTGFLSSLGPSFLRGLYRGIASSSVAFGHVWQDEAGEVLGFIACAESTGKAYKNIILRHGWRMTLPLLRFVLRVSVIKRIIETLLYPAEVGDDLPRAEVLSIAVSPEARGRGVGRTLMETAMRDFADRGVSQARVAVWSKNETANQFYQRLGFRLALTREHHGLPMNVYAFDVG